MKRVTVGLAVVAALGLGCRGKQPKARATAAADDAGVVGPTIRDLTGTAGAAPFPEPRLPMPHQLRSSLLEPGAAPRAVRRYRAIGETRELRVAVTITARSYRDGAWSDATVLPVVTDGFGVTVDATPGAATTTIALRGLVGEIAAGADAGRAEAEAYLGRWRKLLERRRLTVAIDPRGALGAITVIDDPIAATAAADDTHDELVQRWLGLAVPLPAEPIGVGARWRVVTLLRTGGAVVKQTATYRLAAIDGDAWTIAVELERVAEQQLIDVPGLPDSVTTELIALRRTVAGTVTIAATSPLPRAGRLTSASTAHARFTADRRGAIDEVSDDTATIAIESR